jgi:hypothetical protein
MGCKRSLETRSGVKKFSNMIFYTVEVKFVEVSRCDFKFNLNQPSQLTLVAVGSSGNPPTSEPRLQTRQ